MKFKWSRDLNKTAIENRFIKERIFKLWLYIWHIVIVVGLLALLYLIWQNLSNFANLKFALTEFSWFSFLFWLGFFGSLFIIKQRLNPEEAKKLSEISVKTHDKIEISEFFTRESLQVIDKTVLQIQKKKLSKAWRPFYLLREVLNTRDGRTIALRLGINPKVILQKLNRFITTGELATEAESQFLKNLLYKSFEQAVKHKKQHVNIEDLFWALGIIPSRTKDFLADQGIYDGGLAGVGRWMQVTRILQRKEDLAKHQKLIRTKVWRNSLWTSTVTPLLDACGQDLTAQAWKFYPMVKRNDELNKIYELVETGTLGLLLSGRKGTGVMKLVKGLAQKIVSQEVPSSLADRRVHTLSLGRVLALSGAGRTIKAITNQLNKEIQRSGNIILVLEDLPAMEAVKTEEATVILEQLLIDALNNKNLILIATADADDVGQASGMLINALQKIEVKPMDNEATLEVLETMAPYLEHQYKVSLTYQALERTVELSQYLHDIAQPAQAVQVLRQICEANSQRDKKWIIGATVEKAIAQMTGLPLSQVTQDETDVLVNLEDLIHRKYVNQAEAVTTIAAALRRARTKLSDKHRPIGSFLFLGPTGVGKTELARRLAEIYFKSRDRMIRLDMSEYQEPQALRNLIGAPPGTGSSDEGALIKAVKENPFSVILLDELEKAHPDILNIFLQVMEDGRLTSSKGETYDFSHTIIIGTSNAGAVFIQKSLESGLTMADIDEALKKRELLQSFKPEFLNRFDAIVTFKPLGFNEVLFIAKILLQELEDNLAEQGYLFEVTGEAIKDLAKAGFNPAQGARPLRRVIQDRIEDQIAKLILNKKIKPRDKIVLVKDFMIEVEEARHY